MENYLNLEKLSNDLKNLFQNKNEKEEESYFDFEIICEQNQISFKTHKSILSSRSYYFKSLFNSKMKEYQENKLILKDVSSSILFSILNYFYSGKIEINLENAIQILIFSSKYLIDELIEITSNFIKKNLQIETIIDVLKLSESMNLNKLLGFSYKFISKNFEEFIKTPFFLELEENHLNSILSNDYISTKESEIFQSIIKWGKHKSNINQETDLEKEEKRTNTKSNFKYILKEDLIPNQISEKLIQFQKLQKSKDEKELNQFIEKENQNSFIFKTRFKSSTIIKEKEHFDKLKEWINDDEFFYKMKKGFSAKKDGFDCKKWHDICDNKGKTLIKSKWKENYRNKDDGLIEDENAFIFSLRNDKNDRKAEKFQIKQGEGDHALGYYYSNYGPYFGGNESYYYPDFHLNSKLTSGWTNFGFSYDLPNEFRIRTTEAKSYLAGSYNEWIVDELETYFI
ncbi:hypothetical protein M0811_10513 [Anaeramoeba ignava]|uniref:BTB domain-containing protein n=1 Tax=Anaeramoeba ignava TaxID=1746090 RepID=A0A9Q0LDM7_ANAIG|nr:hypothetical protein M0811_10513 [Anaeramoeba ignava]